MKKIFLVFLIFLSGVCYSQITKEIENGVFINFPHLPEYKIENGVSVYSSKTENCLFLAVVQRNIIPEYARYLVVSTQWTESEKRQVANSFLENAVKGKLFYTQSTGNVSDIKKGNFLGRKVSYSAINPVTGEQGKRFSIVLLVRNSIVNVDCVFLRENASAILEKDLFLNSLAIR